MIVEEKVVCEEIMSNQEFTMHQFHGDQILASKHQLCCTQILTIHAVDVGLDGHRHLHEAVQFNRCLCARYDDRRGWREVVAALAAPHASCLLETYWASKSRYACSLHCNVSAVFCCSCLTVYSLVGISTLTFRLDIPSFSLINAGTPRWF
jgi:hypothetical protein